MHTNLRPKALVCEISELFAGPFAIVTLVEPFDDDRVRIPGTGSTIATPLHGRGVHRLHLFEHRSKCPRLGATMLVEGNSWATAGENARDICRRTPVSGEDHDGHSATLPGAGWAEGWEHWRIVWEAVARARRKGKAVTWFEGIILGIVQGLTEFLPISSSAHVSIVGQLLFEGRDPGAAFTAVTQLGTETAVLVYFWKDITRIVQRWCLALVGKHDRHDPDVRVGWLVIIGSLPIVVLGLLLEDAIDSGLRNLWVTVAMLAGIAVVLAIADRHGGENTRDLDQLSWGHGIALGFFQAAALVPGVSRSGATIAGGLFLGYSRETAARYAFLLALPAVFGSGLYKLKDIGSDGAVQWGPTIVATIIAFVIGYAVIAWLLKYISTHSFTVFVWYRLGLAAIVAALLLGGVLTA